MEEQKINQHIAKVLLVKILLASTIATAFFTGISFYIEYENEVQDLESIFENISKTSIPSLAKSLYDIDEERITSQVKSFLQIRPFVRAEIRDEKNQKIVDIIDENVDQIDLTYKQYPLFFYNGVKEVPLGKIKIYATQQYMKERLKKKLFYFFFSQGLKTFIVSFIIVFIFNYYIVRHLDVITGFYKELLLKSKEPNIESGYKQTIKLNKRKTTKTNELDFLVAMLNKMNQIIGDLIIKQKNDISDQKDKVITHAKFAAIGELAAEVGHEINNPLAISTGNLHLLKIELERLQLTPNDDRLEQLIQRQEEANERISAIVESLRNYSRTDSPFIEILTIHDLIERTNTLIKKIYEAQGIRLEITLDANNDHIYGNTGKFQQLLIILLSNAKDAIEKSNSPTIRITTKNEEGMFVVSVSDNGTGIAEETKEKIFQSFFTTKEIGKGVGIGLSILNTIVEEMSGSIKLETEVNRGSTFSLFFPSISKSEEQALSIKKEINTKKINSEAENYSLQGSALVVDDEKGIRDLLVDYLKDMGLKVDFADDGDTALEKIKLRKYDYICTDMTMPRMPGDVFIREAKKLPFGDTKYFVITGGLTSSYSQEEEEEEEIKVIVDSYIYKPFSHTTIYEALSGKVKTKII